MPRLWRRLSLQWWSKNCIANPSHPAYPSVITRCRSGYFSNIPLYVRCPSVSPIMQQSVYQATSAMPGYTAFCGFGFGAERGPPTCMVKGTFKASAISHSGSHSAR